MFQSKDRSVLIGLQSSLFGIDPGGSRLISDADSGVTCCQLLLVILGIDAGHTASVHSLKEECTRRFISLPFHANIKTQSVFPLLIVVQGIAFIILHVVYSGPFERDKHVILICRQEFVTGRHYVSGIRETEIVYRKLPGEIVLFIERVGEFAHTFPPVITESVGHVSFSEYVGMQIRCGLCTGSQTQSFHKVMSDYRIDRTDIHRARFLGILADLHMILNEGFRYKQDEIKSFDAFQSFNGIIHLTFRGGEFFRPVFLPEIFIPHHGAGVSPLLSFKFEGFLRNLFKRVVVIGCGAFYLEFLQRLQDIELYDHLVIGQNILSGG